MGVERASSFKIGVFGGTFDPIHIGHLVIAEEARCRLVLDRVLFIPTGHPYMKTQYHISHASHRLSMLQLAVEGNPGFRVADMEIRRPGPSYTIDTLADLAREYGAATSFYLILGWDSLLQFPRWREPRRILQRCTLVALPRPGFSSPDKSTLEAQLPGVSERLVLLSGPHIGISGTEIRRRVAEGLSIRYWVPDSVEKYIHDHRLYQREVNRE
jgi:nicotinate-nucleotide adenylyltransferase